MYTTLQPAGVERRSISDLRAESKLCRLSAMPASCDQWKVVKLPSADTGRRKGGNGVYTHFFGWNNSMTKHGTDAVKHSMEGPSARAWQDCDGLYFAAWGSLLPPRQVGGNTSWGGYGPGRCFHTPRLHHHTGIHHSLGHSTHHGALPCTCHAWLELGRHRQQFHSKVHHLGIDFCFITSSLFQVLRSGSGTSAERSRDMEIVYEAGRNVTAMCSSLNLYTKLIYRVNDQMVCSNAGITRLFRANLC